MTETRIASVAGAENFVARAHPGSTAIYHNGVLARDRRVGWDLDTYAGLLYRRARAGHLHLAQRRLGPGRFAYIAIKRSR